MKRYKAFQGEAQIAGIQTIEELNATLAAWTEVEYNNKIHSGTGETPNERWRNNLSKHPPRRVKDLEAFNALFLWRTERTIDKFGTIRFQRNAYRIHALAVGTSVELRYNPFDLAEVHVYHQGTFHSILTASTLTRKAVVEVPEQKKPGSYSPEAADYFKRKGVFTSPHLAWFHGGHCIVRPGRADLKSSGVVIGAVCTACWSSR